MSLICDLQMRKYFHIPNDMMEVLDYLSSHSVESCYSEYGIGNKSTINSYIQFVIKNDLGFIDEELIKELIPLPLEWHSYSPITNLIVELEEDIFYETSFIKELIRLNIDALEIRCYSDISVEKLDKFLALVKQSTLISIKLILKWSPWTSKKMMEHMVDTHLRINMILVHSAPENQVFKFLHDTVSLVYSQTSLDSCLQCGRIDPAYFITNVELFTEGQQHNTCLNRKLSIDRYGYIKNCPSMPQSFGHIDSAQLDDVLADPMFKQHWFTKKDDIAICQDCEFRYVCTDCRAYLADPNDPNSKPLKCGYDPYANVWEEWSTNPLKQAALTYYGMDEKTVR